MYFLLFLYMLETQNGCTELAWHDLDFQVGSRWCVILLVGSYKKPQNTVMNLSSIGTYS